MTSSDEQPKRKTTAMTVTKIDSQPENQSIAKIRPVLEPVKLDDVQEKPDLKIVYAYRREETDKDGVKTIEYHRHIHIYKKPDLVYVVLATAIAIIGALTICIIRMI